MIIRNQSRSCRRVDVTVFGDRSTELGDDLRMCLLGVIHCQGSASSHRESQVGREFEALASHP